MKNDSIFKTWQSGENRGERAAPSADRHPQTRSRLRSIPHVYITLIAMNPGGFHVCVTVRFRYNQLNKSDKRKTYEEW